MKKFNFVFQVILLLSSVNGSEIGLEVAKFEWRSAEMTARSLMCKCYNTLKGEELESCLGKVSCGDPDLFRTTLEHFKELREISQSLESSTLSKTKAEFSHLKQVFDDCFGEESKEDASLIIPCLEEKINFVKTASNISIPSHKIHLDRDNINGFKDRIEIINEFYSWTPTEEEEQEKDQEENNEAVGLKNFAESPTKTVGNNENSTLNDTRHSEWVTLFYCSILSIVSFTIGALCSFYYRTALNFSLSAKNQMPTNQASDSESSESIVAENSFKKDFARDIIAQSKKLRCTGMINKIDEVIEEEESLNENVTSNEKMKEEEILKLETV